MHAPGQPSEPMPSPAVLALVSETWTLVESLSSQLDPRLERAGLFERPSERAAIPTDPKAMHFYWWEIEQAKAQVADLRDRVDALENQPPRRFLAETQWALTALKLRYGLLSNTAMELAGGVQLGDPDYVWPVTTILSRQARHALEALDFMICAWVMTGPLDAAEHVPPDLADLLGLGELPRLQSEPDRWHVWMISSAPDPQLVRAGKASPTLFTEGPGLQIERRLQAGNDDALQEPFLHAQRRSLDALVAPGADGVDLLSALGSVVAWHPIDLSGTATSAMQSRAGVFYPVLSVDLSVVTDGLQWYLLDHAQRTLVLRELRFGLGWSQVHYAFSGDPGHALGDHLANTWYREDRDRQTDPFEFTELLLENDNLPSLRERLRAVAAERDREFAALLA